MRPSGKPAQYSNHNESDKLSSGCKPVECDVLFITADSEFSFSWLIAVLRPRTISIATSNTFLQRKKRHVVVFLCMQKWCTLSLRKDILVLLRKLKGTLDWERLFNSSSQASRFYVTLKNEGSENVTGLKIYNRTRGVLLYSSLLSIQYSVLFSKRSFSTLCG